METLIDFPLCRLCLSKSPYAVDVFDEKCRHGYIAAHAIEELLNFTVSRHDKYPQTVCPECLDKLTDFKIFKEQCEESKLAFDKSTSYEKDNEENQLADVIVAEMPIKNEALDYESENSGEAIKNEPTGCGNEDNQPDDTNYSTQRGNFDSHVQEANTQQRMALRSSEPQKIIRVDPTTVNERIKACQGTQTRHFECPLCNTSFSNVIDFKQHQKTYHKVYRGTGSQKESSKSRKLADNAAKRLYQCPLCGRSLSNKSYMKMHMRIHSDEYGFKYEFCGREFRQKGNLLTHRRQHTGERPFVCKTCGKGFPHGSSLRAHEFVDFNAEKMKKYVRRKEH